MPPTGNHRDRTIKLANRLGILRSRDLVDAGIPRTYLQRLVEAGDLDRLGRGLYQRPAKVGLSLHHDLAAAARRVPRGVVCLISALAYYGVTTQLPSAVWLTIPHKARTPGARDLRLEIVRASGRGFTEGVEAVTIEGVRVPIYGLAKTVADCFKYRRQVGEDVAIEALRDALDAGKTSLEELAHFAAIDRVTTRMAPHLDRGR
ncbi:MAG: type IV toxin-antitoxin system AbiEi family antitoxin domain-containing protein [Myxococcales bacterium]|nr:type IV toxin-antitoxin system AbiEi family antitoxin domain-containing protein [Myxococcales bacterium]